MAVSVLLISVLGIFAIMPDAPFVDVLYELTSAIGTVGLSRGLTAVLNTPAKWIVIFTMYLGRIGPLTLARQLYPVRRSELKMYIWQKRIL